VSTMEVSRDALIDLASRLVRIPSFCADETPVARFLAGYLGERGYEVQLQEVEPGRLRAGSRTDRARRDRPPAGLA
jgi:acetylornithine deacetylase/succinyl-diaminopimelate desuccinylase-like protein